MGKGCFLQVVSYYGKSAENRVGTREGKFYEIPPFFDGKDIRTAILDFYGKYKMLYTMKTDIFVHAIL